ncbi:MAG: TIGR00341 family protein [Rickettsiales bacterium]|nr:TIGR00341 family protein [Rickettsiales bacterium]
MVDRMIQIYAKAEDSDTIKELAEKHEAVEFWYADAGDNRITYNVLAEGKTIQNLMDSLQDKLDMKNTTRIVLLPVEAFLPKPEEQKASNDEEDKQKKEEERDAQAQVVREELEGDLRRGAGFDRSYILLVLFSSIVATIGLLENNVAVVVGAMVIAPFLGPNLALTFAASMGKYEMARHATYTLLLGSVIAFATSMAVAMWWPDMQDFEGELYSRSVINYSSIFLALASGAAAVLSLTKGIASTMVGVMVAVALLPPLCAVGIFIGFQEWAAALNAFLSLLVNIVCINLAGLLTLIFHGIGPRTWWEKRKAKTSVYWFSGGWGAALVALAVTIYFR